MFLNWDNEDKNKFVFDITRAAYDYCILTTKENAEESMFSYKKIYLDTNVIFSLAGINGKERMYSSKAFIKKSRELHCNILYTSKTSDECKVTLKNLIEQMSSIVKKDSYLSYDELKAVFPSSNPAALYSIYSEWMKDSPSRNGDFNGFYNHMMSVLEETLDDVALAPIEKSFLEANKELIEKHKLSITSYKEKLGRKHSDNSTHVDACNYCFIDSIRNKQTSTIKNQDVFFISSDTGLCKWADNQVSGYINVFILPSIMYSLMLRFSSRTKDDYKSFNNFVLLSFSNEHITESEQKAKEEMISAIDALDVPKDAKKRILYSANRELERQTKGAEELDKKSISNAINIAIDGYFDEFEKEKNKERENAVSETGEIKYKEGFNDAITAVARAKATKKAKLIRIIGTIFLVFLIAVTIALFSFCILIFIKEKDITSVTGWILAAFSLVGTISIIVAFILKVKKILIDVNFEKIYNKELAKQEIFVEK